MKPQIVVASASTVTTNGIALSQTPASAGNLTLNGTFVVNTRGQLANGLYSNTIPVAVLPTLGRVGITSSGADSSVIFTVYGTNGSGNPITESVTGVSSDTVSTLNDFATVTRIATSAGTVGAITVGNFATWGSLPVVLNDNSFGVQISCVVTGTVNYTIYFTGDDVIDTVPPTVNPLNSPPPYTWFPSNDSNVVSATTTQQSNFLVLPFAIKVVINSGTGSVKMTVTNRSPVSVAR